MNLPPLSGTPQQIVRGTPSTSTSTTFPSTPQTPIVSYGIPSVQLSGSGGVPSPGNPKTAPLSEGEPRSLQIAPGDVPGTGLLGEEEESFTPSLQNIRIQPSRSSQSSRLPQSQRKLEEYPDTFTELDLMPMRCYSCGKVMKQLAIEDALKSGQTLRETMDELNYQKICCRIRITTSPAIVRLQKNLQNYSNIDPETLTLEATEARLPGDTSGFFVGETMIDPSETLQVVEEAPPGTIRETGGIEGICFTGQGPSLLETGSEQSSAFEFFMTQLGKVES